MLTRVAMVVSKVVECLIVKLKTCCREKGLGNCYFCQDFEKCERLGYQKATYKINDHYVRINRISYQNWLKEQNGKARKGFDNVHFLEQKNG